MEISGDNRMKKLLIGTLLLSTAIVLTGCGKEKVFKYAEGDKSKIVGVLDPTITNVVIPNGVKEIGAAAFYELENLESVEMPNSVTTIGDMAFYHCYNLKTINFSSSLKTVGAMAFCCCGIEIENLTFNEGLELIREYAFEYCQGITGTLTFPSTLKEITYGAFSGCDGIRFVRIPGDTIIGYDTFFACNGIAHAYLEGNIKNIRKGTFVSNRLKTIVLPNTLEKIEAKAFEYGNNVQSIFFKGTKEEWDNVVIGDDNAGIASATIYYYAETKPEEAGNYWHYDATNLAEAWTYHS